MAKKIDAVQVRKVAKLSRLDLTEAEVEEFTGQLSAILEYVEKMNELDTENVEPLAHCLAVSNVFREDCVKESLGTEKTLSNAPQRDGEFYQLEGVPLLPFGISPAVTQSQELIPPILIELLLHRYH